MGESKFFYNDEAGYKRSYLEDRIQRKREDRKAQARSQRDSHRDKTQKARDDLFNGQKKEITKSTTRDNKRDNAANSDTKTHKKDQRPNTAGSGGVDRYTAFEVQYVKNNAPAVGKFLMDV